MEIKFIGNEKELQAEGNYSESSIVDFLFKHLEEYGDAKKDIAKCLDFSMARNGGLGGFILVATDGEEIAGVVITNKTGMSGYIPENILVYIATHAKHRGKGIGKALMQETTNRCEGDIALHVEEDNPARFLYEKVGFTNPYLEMRFKRK